VEIKVRARPEFHLKLTFEHVQILTELASVHYDARCKSLVDFADSKTGRRNGLLTLWGLGLNPANPWPTSEYVTAKFHDLDLCMKVMEMAQIMFKGRATKLAIVQELQKSFFKAMRVANNELGKIEYNVNPHNQT